jgi:anti-sigma-K factor RskA
MISDRQEDLACLHALGLLEGPERDQFLGELAGSAELRERVGELRQAAAALAHAAPEATPPEELKARVLASAAERAGRGRSPAAQRDSAREPVLPTWTPWLAAACVAVAAVWAERQYLAVRSENAALSEQRRVALDSLQRAQDQLAEARAAIADSGRRVAELSARLKDEGDLAHYKISTLASMLGNSPAALAVAVWDPAREQGVLAVSRLPAAASDKDYQLWVIDRQYPTPVSAGIFVVDPVTGEARVVFRADKPVNSVAKFAVSLERKGGAPSAQGPIVLLSQ